MDITVQELVDEHREEVIQPSTQEDGEILQEVYDSQMGYFIEKKAGLADHFPGFYYLRGWKDDTETNHKRIQKIFTPLEGDVAKFWSEDKTKSLKDQFKAAMHGSYASAYRLLTNGNQIYDDLEKTAWHVFKQYHYDNLNATEALQETFQLLFGDTVLERNGGIEFPNGIGLWHDKKMMNNYKLTLNEMEEYKINVYHHLIKNVIGGKNITLQFEGHGIDKTKGWDQVAKGIVEGGGSVWWGVVNDVYNDGYRVVLMAQRGDPDAPSEAFGRHMFQTPGSQLPSVEILGDGFYNDGTGVKPIRLTKKQYFDAIAEAPAADMLDSHSDFWDSQHWLFNQNKWDTDKWLGGDRPNYPPRPMSTIAGTLVNLELKAEEAGFMGLKPGPDMSRKRLKHYIDKYGPGTKHYKDTPRAWSFFGTGWGLDFSKPGRLEMDLLWIPLWNELREFEGKQHEYEINQEQIRALFRNRYRGMFKGRWDRNLKNTFSVYDMFYITSGGQADRYRARMGNMTTDELRGLVDPTGSGQRTVELAEEE